MTTHTIEPSRTALLVMDYQPVVLGTLLNAADLLKRTGEAIATVRRLGGWVGYVRVAFEESDYAAVPASNLSFSAVAEARGMPAASPETAIHPAVAPEPSDVVVRKTRVGPFRTTDLDVQLRGRGVDTLLLAGLHTSGVVLSTVREAADLDYRIFVLSDCTADPDAEVHDILLRKVFARQAPSLALDELPGLLGG